MITSLGGEGAGRFAGYLLVCPSHFTTLSLGDRGRLRYLFRALDTMNSVKYAREQINEPSHEIMILFVLRKPVFQTRMRNHWLEV